MPSQLPPLPFKTIVIEKSGFLSTAWVSWFRELFRWANENELTQGPNL